MVAQKLESFQLRSTGNEVMSSLIAFFVGSTLVFLLLTLADNRGWLPHRKKKYGPEGHFGLSRSSLPDGWKPPGARKQEQEK